MFSFAAHKSAVSVHSHLRRICDLTTPSFIAPPEDIRVENRCNRTIPTLICPWENETALHHEVGFVLTKDISEQGVGLVLNQPFHAEEVVLGYKLASDAEHWPWFFVGAIRRCDPLGGGFWGLGVELLEFANSNHHAQIEPLLPLVDRLIPHAPPHEHALH